MTAFGSGNKHLQIWRKKNNSESEDRLGTQFLTGRQTGSQGSVFEKAFQN